MKALVLDGKVVDLSNTEFEVHSDLSWVDCTSDVQVGYSYDGSTFTSNAPTQTADEKLADLRMERNRRLQDTDYLALSDNTMSDAITTYRQELRDITDNYTSLDDVVWPTKP